MPIDFTALTPNKAKELIALPGDRLDVLKQNRDYYEGEHWQNGRAWGGPWVVLPEGAKREIADVVTRFQQEVHRGQVTVNATKEVVERESSAAVGIEPTWSFGPDGIRVPTPPTPSQNGNGNAPPIDPAIAQRATELEARAGRINALMTTWWDEKGVHQQLHKLADRLLYGAGAAKGESEATIRLYVPSAMLADEVIDGNRTGRKMLRVRDMADALAKIHVETLDADQGRVVRDPDTLAPIGVKPDKRGEEEVAELVYLDPNGKTVLATIRGTPESTVSRTFDLGGRLTMITATRAEYLTEQTRQSQRALNFAAFVVRRNNETAGFRQDTLLNAEIPGHDEEINGVKKFVPDPIQRGPLALNVLTGKKQIDAQGNESYTTASIDHSEPIDPTPTIKSKGEHYADILAAVSQRHILLTDVVASAPSREQSLGEHIKSARKTKTAIEKAGRALLETAAALADALTNDAGVSTILAGLRCTVTCTIDTGPVRPDVRAQNVAEMNAGALSRQTTIERNGTIDVDAELARIRSEPNAGLDAELKRAQIYKEWIAGGTGEQFAGSRAGLSPDEIQKLITAPTDTTRVTQ